MNSFLCRELPVQPAVEEYGIGFPVTSFDPAKEVYHYMLRLIAYDITDPARLRKVANVCKDYGVRIEYSVFECDLNEKVFAFFWEKLQKLIDPGKDRLIAYRICAGCVGEIRSVGVVCRPGKVLLYII